MKKRNLFFILLAALFMPIAANAQTLFSEGFEGGSMPSGWTTDGPGTWSVGSGDYSTSTGAGMGTYNALIKHNTTGNVTKLITPEIDLSSVSSAVLSFMHVQRSWAGDIDYLKVYYRTSSSETWTQLVAYTSAISSWTTEEDITLPNTTATYQLAFEHTDNYGYGVGLDQVVITAPSACPKPTLGAAEYITEEGASFQWTENGSATSWELQYSTSNDFSNPTTITRNGIPAYAITGLESGTTYYVHVRSSCGAGEYSDWSNTVSFRTTCGVFNLPYSYGFEDAGELDCWNVVYTANTPGINGDYYYSGTKCFRFSSFSSASSYDQYLISPEFNSANGVDVSFYYTTYGYAETFKVGYSTTDNDPSSFTWGDEISTNSTEWNLFEEVYPAGTKYVGIYYYSSYQYYLYVDDFSFTVPSDCRKPTDLVVSEITTSSAVLRWVENGSATAWEVEVTDLDGGQVTNWNATTNPYEILGLSEDTHYSVRVNPVCDVDKWSDPVTFTTPELCPKPTNLTVSDITPMGATVTWAGQANSYNVAVQEALFFYGFEEAEPFAVDEFRPCTTYDGDQTETYGFESWDFENENYVGACIAWQNGVITTGEADAHSGNACGMMVNAIKSQYPTGVTHTDDWFILPELTIENGMVFSFWAREIYTNYGPEIINVGVYGSTDGTFSSLLDEGIEVYTQTWTQYTYPLDAYAGQTIQLAINCVSDDVWAFMFDDLFVGYTTPTAQAVVYNNVTSPYDLELDPETSYQVFVQSVCGGDNGNSAWVYEIFSTPSNCAAPYALSNTDVTSSSATLSWSGYQESYNIQYRTAEHRDTYYFFDFNNGDNSASVAQEEGWSWEGYIIYGLEDPIYNVSSSSNYFLQMGWATTDEAYIYSPELPAYPSGAKLEFYYFGYNTENTFQVGYSTTTNDADAFTWGDPITAPAGTYTLFSETLPDGIKYVAFKATASEQDEAIFIDDFGVFGPELIPAGEWITVNDVTSPYDLANLAADTPYEWQVQGVNPSCDGEVTEWSEIDTFTTLTGCEAPTDLTVTDITENGATLNWTGTEEQTSFNIRYRTSEDAEILFYDDFYSYEIIDEEEGLYGIGDWTTVNLQEGGGNIGGLFMFYYTENPPQYLISPELDGIEDGSTLQFYLAYQSASWPETFKVGFSTTGTDVDNDFTWGEELSTEGLDAQTFYPYTTSVPEGAKYFAVQCTSEDQYFFYVTDFMIYGPVTPAGEWVEVDGVTSPYDLSELLSGTWYDWEVQVAGCNAWTAGESFETLEGSLGQSTDLLAGWNWFSTYMTKEDPADLLLEIEQSLGDNGLSIVTYSDQAEYLGDDLWIGLEGYEMSNGEMILIEVDGDCTVNIEGTVVDPTTVSITLYPGWNYIGFPYATEMNIDDAFSPDFEPEFGDAIASIDGSVEYLGDWTGGDFLSMIPGHGYMYFNATDDVKTLTFQAAAKVRNAMHNGTIQREIKTMVLKNAKPNSQKGNQQNLNAIKVVVNQYTKTNNK